MRKYKSSAMKSIFKCVLDLKSENLISKKDVKKFKKSCLKRKSK